MSTALIFNPYLTAAGHSGTGGTPDQLIVDDFNRADSTTNLGSASPGGAWTQQAGTWGIESNQAYISSGSGASIATIDAGDADIDIRLDGTVIPGAGNGNAGIVFRYTDTNNFWALWFDSTSGQAQLRKRVGGSFTTVHTAGGISSGDQLRVVSDGNDITSHHNGTIIGTTSDSFNATATKVGMWINLATPSSWRLDNYRCQTLPKTPTGSGTFSDAFTRSDADDLGSPWAPQLALVGISSNEAASKDPDEIELGHSVVSTGNADSTVEATVAALDTAGNAGIVFRWQDYRNFWAFFLRGVSNEVRLIDVQAGSVTTHSTVAVTKTAGDVLKVVLSGTSIDCYHNNNLEISVTSSLYQSNGIHGILINRGGTSTWTIDDFSAT